MEFRISASRQTRDEGQRLAALQRLNILDTPAEEEFDALVEAAALLCDVPISLISLVDKDRQWFKANYGLDGVAETRRDISFCTHAIEGDEILEIPDARLDACFKDNELVTGNPEIRFYAGMPLRLDSGENIGTMCVIGREPQQLTVTQRAILKRLSIAAVKLISSRQLAQIAADSENRFRALSDSSPLGVFSADASGACLYTNKQWQQIFGVTAGQAAGLGGISALHPDDKSGVTQAWELAVASRQDFNMKFRIVRADGSTAYVQAIASALTQSAGDGESHVGTVLDITEQMETSQFLQDERRRLSMILEGTGAGTWEWNVQTGEVRFNERWAQIVGKTLEGLAPVSIDTWSGLVHRDDLVHSEMLLKRHFAGESNAYECEARMRHADGHWVWVLDRGRVLTRTAEGEPEWMFGTHMDITQRKAQEESFRNTQSLLKRTGEIADVGGWELDLASEKLTWSEQTFHIHGVEPGKQPSLEDAVRFYSPEARPVVQAAVEKAIATGTGWDLELPIVRADGQAIWVQAVGFAEFVDDVPVRLLGAIQNISARVAQRQDVEKAHARLTLATNGGGIGVWEFDLSNGFIDMDAQMRRLFRFPETGSVDLTTGWYKCMHREDASRVLASMQFAISDGTTYDDEFRLQHADGTIMHLRASAQVTSAYNGGPSRLVGVAWDVTALRELSAELAGQRELLQVTLQAIGDAVITTDASGRVTWLNPAAERFTGWLSAEAKGCEIARIFHTIDEASSKEALDPVAICLAEQRPVGSEGRTRLISRNGLEFGIEESAAPIRSPQGEILGVVLVFHDVTEQRRLSGEMKHRATHDALTGLINRTEFETRLRNCLASVRETHEKDALLFIDLDQFKLVNDACGHTIGDQLLRQVATLLSECIRPDDTIARLGGDEFAVILEGCGAEPASRVAQKICNRMDDFRFVHDDRRFRIGASIGLVTVDDTWTEITAIMQAADTACYAAKEAGRNRVHQWFDTDQIMRARQGEMQWASRLEQAIDEDRFVLYAQRIKPLGNSVEGCHAEVLLRLRDTDGSLIQPGAFLPAAERFHLASRIDRWVLRRTIQHLLSLSNLSEIQLICINLSGQSVGDKTFHRDAIEVFAAAGPEVCRRICLEITETAAVTAMTDAVVFIDEVRALGVRVALDDFGAGASSFGYLKTMTVDIIKIDGQFIRDLNSDPLDAATVRCFVEIARVVGVQTVAEFVDRSDLLVRVKEIGIDYAQGYLLHRPEPLVMVTSKDSQPRERVSRK